jgi:type VI secretion system ImpC/EvpB family protein
MESPPVDSVDTSEGTAQAPLPETGLPLPPGKAARIPEASLLDAILDAPRAGDLLDQFLEAPPWEALLHWLGPAFCCRRPALKRQIALRLTRDIGRLDALLTRQVNAVIHHPSFQKLEASWRGLHYLVRQTPEGENIKVRVLNITWKELTRDLERAIEFDQSQMFKKVYGEEFGTPGGEPFSVLLGDYEVRHRPGPDHPMDDVATLGSISRVAAAAFAPFIAAAHPALLDLTSFTELELPINLGKTFQQLEYLKWKALRDTEDARFVGLTLPRVLMRLPYKDDASRVDGFRFREDVEGPDRKNYLWGNAAYAFGAILVRAFSEHSWTAAIRGYERGVVGGGLVTGLPVHGFGTDRASVGVKCSTEAIVTDAQEKELGELGFIPLCHCQDTELSAFYGNQSVQKPKVYDELPATVNARLSSMLQYMLCVSRFAHYVKVICRDKVGSFTGPSDCEDYLGNWLLKYTTSNEKAGMELKARYPLREGRVQVREIPGKPGNYMCVVHLRPHFQLDQMVTGVRLVTQLAPTQPT